MNIVVIGSDAAGDYISQKLLSDLRVNRLHHFGANPRRQNSLKFTGYPSDESLIYNFLDSYDRENIDLIITTTLLTQMKYNSIVPALKKKVPLLMPLNKLFKLEWERIKTKKILNQLNIPTPNYLICSYEELRQNILKLKRPYVIKIDQHLNYGLQTIIINDSNIEYYSNNLHQLYKKDANYLIEDYVTGVREYSWHAVSNRNGIKYIGAARDYKRFNDGDQGFNTAGMGCYTVSESVDSTIDLYASKLIDYFASQGIDYIGVIYMGVIVDESGKSWILEVNTRPGTPEFESIAETIDNNLLDLLYMTATNDTLPEIKRKDCQSVSIRLVNHNYDTSIDVSDKKVRYPNFYNLPLSIINSYCEKDRLLHSVLTTTDATVNGAAKKLHDYLISVDTGDFVYRNDVGILI